MPLGRLLVLIFSLTLAYNASAHPLPNITPNNTVVSAPTIPTKANLTQPVNKTAPSPTDRSNLTSELTVTRVIDGDTIELSSGTKVRYIGIDTPEVVDPRKPVQCFGVEASNANKSLVLGQVVRLEKDISETDKYGRLLRYVWRGEILINEELVRQGFARSSSFPPDIKYQSRLQDAEVVARSSGLGLWGACNRSSAPVTQPTSGASKNPPDPSCPIKGNISSSGKIYHVTGQRFYNTTVIDPASGERWFCSEAEALGAGWRKSKL